MLEPLSTSRRALSPSAAAPVFHALTRETVQLGASRCCSLQVGAHRLVCPWRAHNCQAQQAGVVLAAKYQCSYLNHLRSISGSLLDHRRRAGGGIQHPAVRHTVRQTRGGPLAAAGRGAKIPLSFHFMYGFYLICPGSPQALRRRQNTASRCRTSNAPSPRRTRRCRRARRCGCPWPAAP